ncbi:membrane protein of unknown function [Modestobacter italicus]|uniref:TrbL/VirB6 plasmid conjugal transfer protein n=1 Tax=Modestobacter italicus (strain DSM 44449 / CECT 9708 / BC 501) TaxID=2732864 RepID=I4F0H3_MODI5|nr:type IV secretion system protein [Modestobacter marinus]CCH89136.1 membrane protein of unknown function [Modestobacter marinus]
MGEDVVAVDLNPMNWLGDAASAAAADVWKSAMISIWSAGLWLLTLSFKVIDAFTTPDVSAEGPMGAVLPTTLWFGASVAGTMMFVQLTAALIRRDGRSLGRVVIGVAQFGLVWVGYLGVAGGLVAAAAGLSRGVLNAMLNVDSLSDVDLSSTWPREVVDTTAATVLGFSSLLLVVPAAFLYVIVMLVREAALIVLIATAPIAAAGLVSDSTKSWFWKSLRWFFSCLLIAPMAALVLGIGVQLSAGVVAGNGDSTAQAAGTAVIGAVLVAIGAVCPLVVFRLLAFVDPGSSSGAALRHSWGQAGGLSGVLAGGRHPVGSGAASQSSGDGRSHGEATAESQSAGRLASVLGTVGSVAAAGVGATAATAHRAVDVASDVLASTGVGHPGYRTPPASQGGRRPSGGGNAVRAGIAGTMPPRGGGPALDGGTGTPALPVPPLPPGGGLTAWARDGAASAGPEAAAAAVAL